MASSNGSNVRYPDVEVQLTGQDGNAAAIVGAVVAALKAHFRATDVPMKVRQDEIAAFRAEAYGGDYDNLLSTCTRWVDVY